MSAKLQSVTIIEVPDESPDASWLEQEGFEDRLEAYRAGDFYLIGIQAKAEIHIPFGDGFIVQTITSPGLWNVESDSGDEYLATIGDDESLTLRDMLAELGVDLNGLLPDREDPAQRMP